MAFFLGKCWHLLSCAWWRNVLWVLGREIWNMKTKNVGKNRSHVETIIRQLFSLVNRWRNPYGNSFQGDFLLLEETKACKHRNFLISLPLPARVGSSFAPVKLHYFGTARTLGSLFLLSLPPLRAILLTARPCCHFPAGTGAHWLLRRLSQGAHQAGNSSLRKRPSW